MNKRLLHPVSIAIATLAACSFASGQEPYASADETNRWDGRFLPQTNIASHGALLGTIPAYGETATQSFSATPAFQAKPTSSAGLFSPLVDHKSPASASSSATPLPITSTSDVVMLDDLVPIDRTPIRTASLSEQSPPTQTIPYGGELEKVVDQPQLPPGTRNGAFQKFNLTGVWMPALSDGPDTLGITEFDANLVFGFPFPRRDTPLIVTPRFGAHFFQNAAAVDIPSRVFDVAAEFRHMRRFGDGPWAMDAAVSVGYYSDFQIDTRQAVRVNGRAIAVYESSLTTKWLLGAAYYNRAGTSFFPVGGVIYEPNESVVYEALFPRPRIAWRLADSLPTDQRWLYIAGEFGGGLWAIQRPSTGLLDILSYSDLRVLAGYERKIIGGLSRRVEFGYVFYRKLLMEDPATETSLDDAAFVRAGVTY